MKLQAMVSDTLKSHDTFFGRMIDLIPKELYKPPEENDVDVNSKFYKHRKQPLAPDVKKAISKNKRAEKYAVSSSSMAGMSATGDDDDDDNEDDEDEDDNQGVAEGWKHKGHKAALTKKAVGDEHTVHERSADDGADDRVNRGADAVNRNEQLELLRQRLHVSISMLCVDLGEAVDGTVSTCAVHLR